jgi:ribonuclease P protein subunit POP4
MSPVEPRNLLRHELIGLEVRVVKSNQPSHTGTEGTVINETRNTLTINHKGGDKVVAKETSTFQFRLPDGSIMEVEGKNLIKRPEDRVKTRLKKLW